LGIRDRRRKAISLVVCEWKDAAAIFSIRSDESWPRLELVGYLLSFDRGRRKERCLTVKLACDPAASLCEREACDEVTFAGRGCAMRTGRQTRSDGLQVKRAMRTRREPRRFVLPVPLEAPNSGLLSKPPESIRLTTRNPRSETNAIMAARHQSRERSRCGHVRLQFSAVTPPNP